MPVVNILSERLSVEIRLEGKVFRQDFNHGIPHSELFVIGATKETGISVTFRSEQEIITSSFDNFQLMNPLHNIVRCFCLRSAVFGTEYLSNTLFR